MKSFLSPMNLLSTAYNCYCPKVPPPPVCLSSKLAARGTKPSGIKAPDIHKEKDVGIHIGKLLLVNFYIVYCLNMWHMFIFEEKESIVTLTLMI
jgi:hypothetical protein